MNVFFKRLKMIFPVFVKKILVTIPVFLGFLIIILCWYFEGVDWIDKIAEKTEKCLRKTCEWAEKIYLGRGIKCVF